MSHSKYTFLPITGVILITALGNQFRRLLTVLEHGVFKSHATIQSMNVGHSACLLCVTASLHFNTKPQAMHVGSEAHVCTRCEVIAILTPVCRDRE